ncbi:MAG TPA: peroxidase-related enzyme [Candidatus Acidoferrales bacterium]|nr:peroxidase-related enzyme [Candidatus Acidoferrales bacterium]
MAFVTEVEESQAAPELRELYTRIEKGFGTVPHYFKALGPLPEVIAAQLRMSAAIMGDRALSASLKEQIGLVVSGLNTSSYCIAIHMELLQQFGFDKHFARKLATDYERAPVDEKTKTLFRFADKLTRKAVDVEQSDADEVLRAGWSQDALREAVLAVAFFSYINRVSLGLGLVADY